MKCLLVAPTQSGKTRYIQDLSVKAYDEGLSVFITLRNMTADLIQFCNRWKHKVKLNFYNKPIRDNSVYLCLSNVSQLSKMFYTVSMLDHPFIVIMDEADLIYLDRTGEKQTSFLLDECFKNPLLKHQYFVTATPFRLLKCVNVEMENIHSLPRHDRYVGFEDISEWHIIDADVRRLSTKNVTDKLPDEFYYQYSAILTSTMERGGHQIILFNCTSFIEFQETIGWKFFNDKDDIDVIIDHGLNTYLYTTSTIPTFTKTRENFIYSLKNYSIKVILKQLKIFSSSKTIVIVSGIKAGRGQSYKTEDDGEWHLTDLIYLPPKKQSVETMIQACGRITGVYKDNHRPLHIWTHLSVKDAIEGYVSFRRDFLSKCNLSGEECSEMLRNTAF
jgi:hypothetical protein